MRYTVYVLYSQLRDRFYIGYTSDLQERVTRHNQKSKGFTGSINDWEIKYYETHESKTDAICREKQIKSWKSKVKIKELIVSFDSKR